MSSFSEVANNIKKTEPCWLKFLPEAFQTRLRGRANLHSVLQNSGWLFFDKGVRLALGLIVGAWVARYLGPSQFGGLAYILAYIALFQAIANLGLDGIVVREISLKKNQAPKILGTVFVLRFAIGLICWFVAIGIMIWLRGWNDSNIQLTALIGGSLVFQAADTVDLWFQSQSKSKLTVLSKLAAYITSSTVKVILVLIHAPLTAFAVAVVFEGVVTALSLAFSYRRFPCQEPWKKTNGTAIFLLKESWPFILSGISIMIYMRIDQIMIREMLGARELGVFAVVLPLATLWQFIPMMLNTSLAPFVARKKAENEQEYWSLLEKIFRAYALLGWLVCMPTLLLAHFIINALYGIQYKDGASVLMIYVFTNLFINMGVAQGLWLLNERCAILNLVNTLTGAIVCILGNILFIPRYGLIGAAWVAVLAQFCSAVLINVIFNRRILSMQIRSVLWPL